MKLIAIVGTRPPNPFKQTGREFDIYDLILQDVARFCRELDHCDDPILVSGGAEGVDSHAEEFFGQMIICRPDYAKHGKRAPLERNSLIVETCHELHAWPSPWSRGTFDTISKAKSAGKLKEIHRPWLK